MSINLIVPEEIPADEEVLVIEVLKQNGEEVSEGDVILIIETSKTTYEIVSIADGIVEHQLSVGSETKSGQVIATVKAK